MFAEFFTEKQPRVPAHVSRTSSQSERDAQGSKQPEDEVETSVEGGATVTQRDSATQQESECESDQGSKASQIIGDGDGDDENAGASVCFFLSFSNLTL